MPYPSLNALAAEIHETAKEKGWWDEPRNFGEILALMHSELSEALEAWRDDEHWFYRTGSSRKPEGIGVELIDCVIRILDALHANNVDIDTVMAAKVAYNETRPYRHGGKRA